MLDRGDGRDGPDGIGPRHVGLCIKESGKAHFKAMMSWTINVEGGEVNSTDFSFTLRAGFSLVVGKWEMWVLGGW